MTPERYAKISEIFQTALDYPPSERDSFLAQVCTDDTELRLEVAAMLKHHKETDQFSHQEGFLNLGLQLLEKSAPLPSNDIEPGKRIGPYSLVRKLAQGGMGVVYEAVRTDDQFRQRVAIKILPKDMDARAFVQRFRNERQILASLNHNNIARLFEGGTTDDGLPYFIMEFIEGKPIDDYCNENNLSITKRLELFLTVCDAIQYAHRNLVVHRDLKPSNILVTNDGTPKLLDFGIAKVLEADNTIAGVVVTENDITVGKYQPMTPAYASPEQIRGEVITTASDVYALGVLLYEMLTGQRPYRLKTNQFNEIAEIICQQEPVKPSSIYKYITATTDSSVITPAKIAEMRKTTPVKLKRRLAGDLDNIVLMALRKEPQRRYSSVEQFAQDIQRHLKGLPVVARQDTFIYRTGKFIRRYKLAVAATFIIILSLVSGIVATTWQAHVAYTERLRAEARYQDQRELINTFIFELHDEIQALPGATPVRERFLKRAENFLDKQQNSAEATNDTLLLHDLATTEFKFADVLGRSFGPNLGDINGALLQYQKAVTIFKKLAQENPTPTAQTEFAQALKGLGLIQQRMGNNAAAAESFQQTEVIFAQLVKSQPTETNYQIHLADTYIKLGDISLKDMDLNGALNYFQKALSISQSFTNREMTDKQKRLLGISHYRVGLALEFIGDFACERLGGGNWTINIFQQACDAYQIALSITETLLPQNSDTVTPQADVANCAFTIAKMQAKLGQREAALANMHRALEICNKLANLDQGNVEMLSQLSVTHKIAGQVYTEFNDFNNALKQYEEAERLRLNLLKESEKNAQYQYFLVELYQQKSICHARYKQPLQQESCLREALRIITNLCDQHPINTGFRYQYISILIKLTDLLTQTGRTEEATSLISQVFAQKGNMINSLQENEYAWLQLASSIKSAGKPSSAVEMIQQTNKLSAKKNLLSMATLTLAYMENQKSNLATEKLSELVLALPLSSTEAQNQCRVAITDYFSHFQPGNSNPGSIGQ